MRKGKRKREIKGTLNKVADVIKRRKEKGRAESYGGKRKETDGKRKKKKD